MRCGLRPDGPAAESSAKEKRASWTTESEGVRRGRPGQSGGGSFWQCLLFEVAGQSRTCLARISEWGARGSSNRSEQGPKVGRLSSRHLFVERDSYRRVCLWRYRRVQVPASVSEEFVVSARGSFGAFMPLFTQSSDVFGGSLLFCSPFLPSKDQFF